MGKILNVFKKNVKKVSNNTEGLYRVKMATADGVTYEVGIQAKSDEEAKELILYDARKGNTILGLRKVSKPRG